MAQRRNIAQSPGAPLKAATWPRRAACLLAVSWLLVAAAAQAQTQTAACPVLAGAGVRQVAQGELTLSWRAVPHPIPLSKPFDLEVVVCGPAAPQLLRVDADMPAHRHGMNYRTSISTAPDGQRNRIQGLVFHMPGNWRLIFDVQQGDQRLRLTDRVELY